MRVAELHPGDRVLVSEWEDKAAKRMPLIVLGPSKENNSVVLLANKALCQMQMGPWRDVGDYFHSSIDDYLETVFMDCIPCSLKQALVKTRIYAEARVGEIGAVGHDRRRVFLPSINELGFGTMPMEGISYIDALKIYFCTGSEKVARCAIEEDSYSACCYWTRSSPNGGVFYCVTSSGDGVVSWQNRRDVWVRPCFSVSVDAGVVPATGVSGSSCYELTGMETKRVIQEDLFMRLMTL